MPDNDETEESWQEIRRALFCPNDGCGMRETGEHGVTKCPVCGIRTLLYVGMDPIN